MALNNRIADLFTFSLISFPQPLNMIVKKFSVPALLLLLLLSVQLSSQTIVALPRSIPETEGVSSKGILEFLDAVGTGKHEFHSFMFLRHGKVIAEGWWNPYRPDLKHTMYSVSKSFTSTAIGFAVSEKRLTVNDKVISFFPDKLPDTASNYLAALTIKDLLTMSVGQAPDPTGTVAAKETDWVKSFLALSILKKPGSEFLYNSLGTFMLSAIVQKVTGQKVIDYLRPRLFKPLGITGMDWETDPMSTSTGGWGLRIKTEDMARFGQLYLQKGKWNGKQVLPEEWVEEATTFKIDQAPSAPQSKKDSSDWMQGYCYQFWRSRNNSYRGDGAFGQYILVLPEQDAVIVITSETANMQEELNLVWQYLLPAMQKDKIPADKNAATALKQRLSLLKLPLPAKTDSAFKVPAVSGKNFTLEHNESQVEKISFIEKNHVYTLTLKTNAAAYSLNFGQGKWVKGVTGRLGPSLVGKVKGHFKGLPPSQVAGSYSWKDPNTLEMLLRYIDSPHTETMTFHFDQNRVSVDIRYSFVAEVQIGALKGEIMKR
jgi:CubicO group peptidase (beta-lactamase class C family)